MLAEDLSSQLKELLKNLKTKIQIVASLNESDDSANMSSLLEEISEMHDLISLSFEGDVERRPSFRIERPGSDVKIDFAGVPLGHEFSSLVLALLHVGAHPPKVTPEVIEKVKKIDKELFFETYYSLSCMNCPDVVQALNIMSVINPLIKHTAIDGAMFQEEVDQKNVKSIPTIFCNGEFFEQGRVGIEEILLKLDPESNNENFKQIEKRETFDVLVVGGGPAGASAAIYSARKGIRTGIVTEKLGGQLLETLGIENLISDLKTEGPKLASELAKNIDNHEIDLIENQKVANLNYNIDSSNLIEIELASGSTLSAKSLVIATGAEWLKLGIPGEEEYLNRGVAYCPHCDGPIFANKDVAVIGGGNSGVEAAIDLAGIVKKVTVVEFDTQLRADDILQQKLNTLSNVDVILNAQSTKIEGDGEGVTSLIYSDRSTSEEKEVRLDGIFVQIGLFPNTSWLEGIIDLNDRGEILIDQKGNTSVSNIFAAGDCTTVPYKQIVVALGSGSIAALSAFEYLMLNSTVTTT